MNCCRLFCPAQARIFLRVRASRPRFDLHKKQSPDPSSILYSNPYIFSLRHEQEQLTFNPWSHSKRTCRERATLQKRPRRMRTGSVNMGGARLHLSQNRYGRRILTINLGADTSRVCRFSVVTVESERSLKLALCWAGHFV